MTTTLADRGAALAVGVSPTLRDEPFDFKLGTSTGQFRHVPCRDSLSEQPVIPRQRADSRAL